MLLFQLMLWVCQKSTVGDHGRIEIRRYTTGNEIDWLQGKEQWPGLKTITIVQRERYVGDMVSSET